LRDAGQKGQKAPAGRGDEAAHAHAAASGELLGVHRETIYRLIAHGDLASVRVGSLLRVAAVDVDAYLARA